MNYLIDTNVVSELVRRAPDDRVRHWFDSIDDDRLFLSVLTLGEIANGAAMAARRDPARGRRLGEWLTLLRDQYGARIVGVDAEIALCWGQFSAMRPLSAINGLLAATAMVRAMTLVTRDTADVAATGVATLNPFAG